MVNWGAVIAGIIALFLGLILRFVVVSALNLPPEASFVAHAFEIGEYAAFIIGAILIILGALTD